MEQTSVPYSHKPHGFEALFEFRKISPLADINAEVVYKMSLGNARLVAVQLYSRNVRTSDANNKFHLSCIIEYDHRSNTHLCTLQNTRELFNLMTVQDLASRFQILCRQLFCSTFDRKNQSVYELSIALPTERDMMQQLNKSVVTSHVTCCIHQAFVQQASMHPNKLAITLDNQSLTYGQLLTRVQQLALFLINDKGIQPGDIVCQCIDRSIEMIVGIMGIMMSGAVYAPLSPYDPPDRIDSLVRQVNAKLVLTNHVSSSHLRQLSVLIVDICAIINSSDDPLSDAQVEQLSEVAVTPDFLSHLVFTSGSTGTPKTVQIRHRNFMSYMDAHFIQNKDIILQLASSSFDVHLDEIDSALVRGAHLILLKVGGHLDLDYVTKVIHYNNVTFVAPVPSWMDALGKFLTENRHAQERVKPVQWWFLGGEQLLSSTVRQCLAFVDEQCHILNSYGPAEITEAATCYEIRREDLSTIISLPIGRPLAGYRIYLLDEYRQPVVPGQEGEIIIGGKSHAFF